MKPILTLFRLTFCVFLLSVAFDVIAESVSLPNVGLSLDAPAGFESATRFDGLVNNQTKDTILIAILPEGTPKEYVESFTDEILETRGITVQSREQITISGVSALLIEASQFHGNQSFGKWLLLFSNNDKNYVINASYRNPDVSEKIRNALISIKFLADQDAVANDPDDFSFTIEESDSLKRDPSRARIGGKTMTFSESGDGSIVKVEDPLLIVAESFDEQVFDDQLAFAKNVIINDMPQFTQLKITTTNEIEVDGLPAIEVFASARDVKTKAQLRLYQLIIYISDGSYIRAFGGVGESTATKFLPTMQKIAKSITLKEQLKNKPSLQKTSTFQDLQSRLEYKKMNYEQLVGLMGRKQDSSRYFQDNVVRHQWRNQNDKQLTIWLKEDTIISSSISNSETENLEGCYVGTENKDGASLTVKVAISEQGGSVFANESKIANSSNLKSWHGTFESNETELTLMFGTFAKKENTSLKRLANGSLKYQSMLLQKTSAQACHQREVSDFFKKTQ